MQTLFKSSRDYASLAGRLKPNASDVLAAQGESSHSARKLKRESKRRRKGEYIALGGRVKPPSSGQTNQSS